jgi:hypothetical protein
MYYAIAFVIASILIYAWLNQPIKYAVVEPVDGDGLIRVKLLSKTKRWRAFWGDWKALICFWSGLVVGWWLGWML